jgi:prepilin-type N-terminal cleavage/methylation domain-containing protein
MRRSSRPIGEQGFTLIELMVVLAILAILVSIASVSYQVFIKKAITVEAEFALNEVNRLEILYHQTHSQYSSDLTALGYAPTPPLRYYTLEVRTGAGGIVYQAIAKPKGSRPVDPWVLTRYENGTMVLEQGGPSTTGGGPGQPSSPDSGPGAKSAEDTSSLAGKNKSSGGEVTNIVPLTLTTNPSMITGGSAASGGK